MTGEVSVQPIPGPPGQHRYHVLLDTIVMETGLTMPASLVIDNATAQHLLTALTRVITTEEVIL